MPGDHASDDPMSDEGAGASSKRVSPHRGASSRTQDDPLQRILQQLTDITRNQNTMHQEIQGMQRQLNPGQPAFPVPQPPPVNVPQAPPQQQNVGVTQWDIQQLLNGVATTVLNHVPQQQGQAAQQAGGAQPAAAGFQVPFNNLLNRNHEDHPPTGGVEDIKGMDSPMGFTGERIDARQFLERVESYFALKPNRFRLTKTRLIFTCQLITTEPAIGWANAVSKAVVDYDNSTNYYTDNWASFKNTFLKTFGIPNEKQWAQERMMTYKQGNYTSFQAWVLEWRRLQILSGESDGSCVIHFKKCINDKMYNALFRTRPIPTTLDDMIEVCRDEEQHFISEMSTNRDNRKHYRYGSQHTSNHNNTYFYHQNARRAPDPDAMQVDVIDEDVDALRHKRRRSSKERKSKRDKKGKGKARDKGEHRDRKHPSPPVPSSSSTHKAGDKYKPIDMTKVICHRCGGAGHYMRSCEARVDKRGNTLRVVQETPRDDDDERDSPNEDELPTASSEESSSEESDDDEDAPQINDRKRKDF
jgi:hypothetical protein